MKIEWKKNTHSWIGVAKTDYPRFEVWRSDNLFDNCWCLNIMRDLYLGVIEVRDLPSLEDAKLFAEGSLKELDYGSDISDHRLSNSGICGSIDVCKSRFGL